LVKIFLLYKEVIFKNSANDFFKKYLEVFKILPEIFFDTATSPPPQYMDWMLEAFGC